MNIDNLTILNITTQKPHSTGSGTYMTELIKSYSARGLRQGVVAGIYHSDEVHFPEGVAFYPVYYTKADEEYIQGDISFPVLGMSDIMPYTSTMYQDLTQDMINEMCEAFLHTISRAIAELDPDIILCHHLFLLTAVVREAFPDRKIIGVCHGSDLRQMTNCVELYGNYANKQIDSDRVARGIASLDAVMLLHDEQIDKARTLYNVPEDRIHIIGTGYNSNVFAPSITLHTSEEIRIIYAGKICKEKGIAELLDALDTISQVDALPPIRLQLAGGCKDNDIKGRLLRTSAEEAEDAFIPADVLAREPFTLEYLGLLSQPELAAAFNAADIFVLPSYYEGLPLVLIEAMATGLETICTDLPGVRSWLDKTIPGYNTRFVSLPKMATIDSPDPDSVHEFVSDLGDVLRETIVFCQKTAKANRSNPDTSSATWDAVADRIISNL